MMHVCHQRDQVYMYVGNNEHYLYPCQTHMEVQFKGEKHKHV